ncbi:MAG: hypothetical protein AAB477_03130 [Patescibacteria group bacterium]|mgnify:CR=1 FL=1
MPMVNIKYDAKRVPDSDAIGLATAIQKIVAETTGIPEVFVYADSPKVQAGTDPVEIFVEMSASAITDIDGLVNVTKEKIKEWKKEFGFKHPITLTITPMNWKFEVGI